MPSHEKFRVQSPGTLIDTCDLEPNRDRLEWHHSGGGNTRRWLDLMSRSAIESVRLLMTRGTDV